MLDQCFTGFAGAIRHIPGPGHIAVGEQAVQGHGFPEEGIGVVMLMIGKDREGFKGPGDGVPFVTLADG